MHINRAIQKPMRKTPFPAQLLINTRQAWHKSYWLTDFLKFGNVECTLWVTWNYAYTNNKQQQGPLKRGHRQNINN